MLIICLFTANYCFSQQLPDYENVKMEKKADYAEADKVALTAANFILSNPCAKNDINRLKSLQFVIKWMSGSPDFKFSIDESAVKLARGNDELLALYMTAMSKFALKNRDEAGDAKKMKLAAIRTLIAYCENETNNMKMSRELRKLSEANKNGSLESVL